MSVTADYQRKKREHGGAKAVLLLALLFSFLPVSAQDEPEYRLEVGAAAGLVSYQGDLNGKLLKNLQPMGSLVGRYKLNPRMALALTVSYGQLKSSADGVKTWYPDMEGIATDFKHTLIDAGVRFEYNFWPYGTGREYRGAKPLTPFVALGLGGTFVGGEGKAATVNVPIGVGLRYKVSNRLNLGVEWMMHFSLSDKLDGVQDPYGIRSKGLFKNTDCYSALQVSLTYDLWAKCKICNKE